MVNVSQVSRLTKRTVILFHRISHFGAFSMENAWSWCHLFLGPKHWLLQQPQYLPTRVRLTKPVPWWWAEEHTMPQFGCWKNQKGGGCSNCPETHWRSMNRNTKAWHVPHLKTWHSDRELKLWRKLNVFYIFLLSTKLETDCNLIVFPFWTRRPVLPQQIEPHGRQMAWIQFQLPLRSRHFQRVRNPSWPQSNFWVPIKALIETEQIFIFQQM